eukprot:gene6704-3374_t
MLGNSAAVAVSAACLGSYKRKDKPDGFSAAVAMFAAYLGSYKRKDKPDGFRLLMVSKDHYVSLHQQGVTVGGREEALGTIT